MFFSGIAIRAFIFCAVRLDQRGQTEESF